MNDENCWTWDAPGWRPWWVHPMRDIHSGAFGAGRAPGIASLSDLATDERPLLALSSPAWSGSDSTLSLPLAWAGVGEGIWEGLSFRPPSPGLTACRP